MTERLTIADAIHELATEHGVVARLDDRTLCLPDPVKGSPHLAVLQALGVAADDPPVGAAAHGPQGVAAGVWSAPDLYIIRWTGASRWVAHYHFSSRGRPDDYLRDDAGIPKSLNRDNWYSEVPDEVIELFLSVGLLPDEPPFAVPTPPPPPPEPPRRPSAQVRSSATRAPNENRPRVARPRKPPAPPKPKKAVPPTRTCVACNLQKHTTQFEDGSELCIDCR